MREVMLFFHFLGLAMGVGSGIANLFIGMANKDLPPEEAGKFFLRLRASGYAGMIGLGLLILSGGYLLRPFAPAISSMPYLLAKLVCVAILVVILLIMDRRWRSAMRNGGGKDLMVIMKLGRIALPLSLLIIILAVASFH